MRSILTIKFCDTDRKNDKKSRKNRIINQYPITDCSKNRQLNLFFLRKYT
nr:MAG TPA: hypothetical protein [Bacteriophage sp.]